jgi:ATP-dependent Zn protease
VIKAANARPDKVAMMLIGPDGAETTTFGEIAGAARRIMDESYERVKTILTNRRAELERIADALITKETLSREEINQLLAQSSLSRAAVV